ncbi:hypothetical protein M2284_001833 [Rhodococcus sp. LBL1]|nr:hypothetical protein [Rhodococcus sp. LBL1]MDH6683221.1 hypothetical protein [Rhodococcus sp. LBL2]
MARAGFRGSDEPWSKARIQTRIDELETRRPRFAVAIRGLGRTGRVSTERWSGVGSWPRMRGLLLPVLQCADGLRAVLSPRRSRRPFRPQGGMRMRMHAPTHVPQLLRSNRSSLPPPFHVVTDPAKLPVGAPCAGHGHRTRVSPWRAVQGMGPEQTAQVIFDLRFYRRPPVTSDPAQAPSAHHGPRREHRHRTARASSPRSRGSRRAPSRPAVAAPRSRSTCCR